MNINNNVRETFAKSVTEVGLNDQKLICIVSDISHYRLQELASQRKNQYFNLGVCENSIINLAAGLASLGKIPVVHTFASFLVDRSFEQIKISFGYHKLPVNIIVIGSGIEYAYHGVTHHSYMDSAMIKSIENSKVYNPGSTYEFDELFKANYNNNCINLFRATTQPHNFFDMEKHKIESDKAIKIRNGHGGTIFCSGGDLAVAIEFSEDFPDFDVEIIYFHTLKPLDEKLITESVSKNKKFITLDHQSIYGGLHQDILFVLSKNKVNDFLCDEISLSNKFSRNYGTYSEQNDRLGFTSSRIKDKLIALHG